MSITFTSPQLTEMKPRIVVMGVGGAGGNAVNNMIRSGLEGVDFSVANTDAQSLSHSEADLRIQLGPTITEGLGAGGQPEVGSASAEESIPEIEQALRGSHMAFIAAGMGGGTGTGAAPVIAKVAKELGVLTVGIVTKPFQFEGSKRMLIAERGIEELERYVDTLIIIPNQNLFRVANENTTFEEAFKMADQVLDSGVRDITELMVKPGIISLDFADVKTVMGEMGKAMMGSGKASGDRRAIEAAEAAISNPLLDDVSMKGARAVLINITGGSDLKLFEVDEAANRIRSEVAHDANIIVGSTFESDLEGELRVSVVATGIQHEEGALPKLTVVGGADSVSEEDLSRELTSDVEDEAELDRPLPGFELMDEISDDNEAPLQEPEIEQPIIPMPVESAGPTNTAFAIDMTSALDVEPELAAEPNASDFPATQVPEAQEIEADEVAAGIEVHAAADQATAIEAQIPAAPIERGPSLWQRIRGVKKSRRAEDNAMLARHEAVEPTLNPADPEDQLSMFTDSRFVEAEDGGNESAGVVTSADRLTVPHNEENQLEIPAFLRRTAN